MSFHGYVTKIPLNEEVAESSCSPIEVVPSLLGPHPTVVDKTQCSININSMQLVPFTGSDFFEDNRGSRKVEYPTLKGKGLAISYLDALKSKLVLPKTHISPLKVNSFIPLIPDYVSHEPRNSLSIVPHNQIDIPIPPNDFVQVSTLLAISKKNSNLDDKPKRKHKSIEDILGLSKPISSRKGGRRANQKCVVFRSAMAAAALSVSTEGITNRNKILLSESKAARSITEILRSDFMGDDDEVISRIMVTDEEAELMSTLQDKSH